MKDREESSGSIIPPLFESIIFKLKCQKLRGIFCIQTFIYLKQGKKRNSFMKKSSQRGLFQRFLRTISSTDPKVRTSN